MTDEPMNELREALAALVAGDYPGLFLASYGWVCTYCYSTAHASRLDDFTHKADCPIRLGRDALDKCPPQIVVTVGRAAGQLEIEVTA